MIEQKGQAANEAYAQAERRVGRARESGEANLNLSISLLEHIPPLQGLSALRKLSLSGTRVFDLAPLHGLATLQRLDLNGTQVSDITPLEGLTALQELHLGKTSVSDLAPLHHLTALQRLDLDGALVSNLAPLQHLSALRRLDLDGTPVFDLAPLRGLIALQELYIGGTKVSDLTPLQGLTSLQRLDLEATPVLDLTPLEGLITLEWLGLCGAQVSDLAPIANLVRLMEYAEKSPRSSGLDFDRCLLVDERLLTFAALNNPDRTVRTINFLRVQRGLPQYEGNAPELPPVSESPARASTERLLEQLKHDPLGARALISDDTFVLELQADDAASVDEDMGEQFRREALRKIQSLQNCSARLRNNPGWTDLPDTVALFREEIERKPSEYARRSLTLWSLSVSLASFIEQSREARGNSASYISPLEPEIERALSDVNVTVAPFIRMYETPRQFDSNLSDFRAPPAAIGAAHDFTQRAGRNGVLRREDAAVVSASLGRPELDGQESRRAHGFGFKTALNLARSVFVFLFNSDPNKGERRQGSLDERATDLLLDSDGDVIQMYEGGPPDMREAARGLIERKRRERMDEGGPF